MYVYQEFIESLRYFGTDRELVTPTTLFTSNEQSIKLNKVNKQSHNDQGTKVSFQSDALYQILTVGY